MKCIIPGMEIPDRGMLRTALLVVIKRRRVPTCMHDNMLSGALRYATLGEEVCITSV